MDGSGPDRSCVAARLRAGTWTLVTAAGMQGLDRRTIDEQGVPGEILMEAAGRALVAPADRLRATGSRSALPIRAFCGVGNNGGDGFVAVRLLRAEGIDAEAVLLGDPARLPADAAASWRRLIASDPTGGGARVVRPDDASIDWARLLDQTSVVIDALFGTGLRRPIEGGLARVIGAIAGARLRGLRVLAVDLPSGVCADTGRILGVALPADRTITLSLPKPGLALEPGRSLAGPIEVARIGIADPPPADPATIELWNERGAARRFPARPRAGHKGSFGHVLVAAGSAGKWGAASLACRAALRAGAGLVTLVVPDWPGRAIPELCAEVMTEVAVAGEWGGFAEAAAKAIGELAEARSVLAIGPGIGLERETARCVAQLVDTVERPLVVDADGLNALVGDLGRLRRRFERGRTTVLTPHPGEAARLLATDAASINGDRVAAARRLAEESGAVVVLKGAGTVVAAPGGRVLIVPTGGPVLGSGGTGDVLTGLVAALVAGGLAAFEAAGLAAWWHGATADGLPASAIGFGLRAGELADALPARAVAIQGCGGDDEAERGSRLLLRFPGP